MFCTNCGNEVSAQAIACTKCGLPPRKEKRFCYNCGTEINAQQVMCVKCGVALGHTSGGGASVAQGEKNKTVAALLALFIGWLGAHKFYHGSWGWGLVYLALTLTVVLSFIPGIAGVVEAVIFFTMDEAKYEAVYRNTPPAPFKW